MGQWLASISTKILLSYGSILLITLLAALTLVSTTSDVEMRVNTFVGATLPELESIEQLSTAVNQLELAAYSLYGTTSTSEEFKKRRKTLDNSTLSPLTNLNNEQHSQRLSSIRKGFETINGTLNRLQQTMSAESIDWDQARNLLNTLSSDSAAITKQLSDLKSTVARNAAASSEMIIDDMSSATTTLLILVGIIMAVTIAAVSYTRRLIVAPIGTLSRHVESVAANLDLSTQLPQRNEDEVGRATGSFNNLLGTFRGSINEVLVATTGISSAVASLGSTASSSDQAAAAINREIAQLVLVITDLEAQIENGAKRSDEASQTAQRGAGEVESGVADVERATKGIQTLAGEIETTAEMLIALRTTGDQVSSVVSTIADIADQTNLLALNAAIEAARAGESGRGFAVVADEVRTLANRTHQSTVEINTMLETIVNSISASVNTMATNQEQAKQCVDLAEHTIESLSAIQKTIQSLSVECDETAGVSDKAQKQMAGLRTQVQQFKVMGDTVADASAQTQEASSALTDLAATLQSQANAFKV